VSQLPILPPPWGPRRDPHFDATKTFEAGDYHQQVTVGQAVDKGWYYRSEWWRPLVPDTRRCVRHGEIMYEPLQLTPEEQATYYRDQQRGMATGPIG